MPTPEIDPREFVAAMTVPIRQAMASVRWLEGRVRNRPKPEEITPEKAALTDADCVSQEILLVALRERFPQVGLDVEEDTPSVARFRPRGSGETVVIDPIDGTLRYLRGDGPYATLVGLERDGRVLAALVGLPQSDLVIRAVPGGGAWMSRDGGEFERARAGTRGASVYVSYGLPAEIAAALDARGAKRVTAAGAVIAVAPLLDDALGGLRVMAGAEGMSRRAWIAALATREAGGVVEGLEGPLPERYRPGVRGLVSAASADVLADLRRVLAPAAR
jgi:fructose-1,6-bisphosphatase/inositol monophosphatase family enzyme